MKHTSKMDRNEAQAIILVLYTTGIIFWIIIYCTCKDHRRSYSNPEISNFDLNSIQMDNNCRHLTSIRSDQQNCLVPLNIVFNGLEYENVPSHEQSNQSYNVAQSSRTNISTPQATIVLLSSGLNDEELNTSNVTSFTKSSIDDPPPSYDECMASSRSTPHIVNLPVI